MADIQMLEHQIKRLYRNPLFRNLSELNSYSYKTLISFVRYVLSSPLHSSVNLETNKKKSKGDDRVRRQESRYIKMVRAVFTVCRRQHVPLYSSRYSRKDFTLWQHIALIALMQRIRKSYREYVNDYLTTTRGCLMLLASPSSLISPP